MPLPVPYHPTSKNLTQHHPGIPHTRASLRKRASNRNPHDRTLRQRSALLHTQPQRGHPSPRTSNPRPRILWYRHLSRLLLRIATIPRRRQSRSRSRHPLRRLQSVRNRPLQHLSRPTVPEFGQELPAFPGDVAAAHQPSCEMVLQASVVVHDGGRGVVGAVGGGVACVSSVWVSEWAEGFGVWCRGGGIALRGGLYDERG